MEPSGRPGRNGRVIRRLKALGRLSVFALLVFGVVPLENRWFQSAMKGADEALVYVVSRVVQLAVLLVFAWGASKLERRPFSAYGMPWRQALRSGFWKGVIAGIVSLSVLIFALSAAGALHLSMAPQKALAGAAFGLVYGVIFLLLAMREEFLCRGYALFTLTEIAGFWVAAAITTLWFTDGHAGTHGENPIGLANVALFGLIACFTLLRTGSLWLAIGFHAAWDWGETYFYGVADSGHAPAPGHLLASVVPSTAPAWLSGGGAGPEGSALCLVLFALLAVICIRFLPDGRRPS